MSASSLRWDILIRINSKNVLILRLLLVDPTHNWAHCHWGSMRCLKHTIRFPFIWKKLLNCFKLKVVTNISLEGILLAVSNLFIIFCVQSPLSSCLTNLEIVYDSREGNSIIAYRLIALFLNKDMSFWETMNRWDLKFTECIDILWTMIIMNKKVPRQLILDEYLMVWLGTP